MKKIKRLLIPITLFAGLTLSSCSVDLAKNYSPADLDIDTPWEDYNIPATGIQFGQNEQHIAIEKGETYQYHYEIQPKGASATTLNWVSDNESVATISNTGLLTAVSGGHANITVSEAKNSFDPIQLGVEVTVKITDFNVSLPSTDLDWNHDYQVQASYTPEDTTYKNLIWTIPEEEQTIATVSDSGVITTYQETGTVHLTVQSAMLSGVSRSLVLDVRDRKIHVNSIANAIATGEPSRIEIGHTTQVVATIDPANAEDAATLKYYSRNPDIATVDMDTGVVTGVASGEAKIFANCEGVDSNDVTIDVYEVYATSISITNQGDIIVTNDEDGQKQLNVAVGVSEVGASAPTFAQVSYISSDPDVISVSNTGLLTSLKSGNATITASINGQGDNVYTDSISVQSKAYVTNIVISGPSSAFLDETATLSATVTPSVVEDEIISWSVNPADKVTTEISGNTITLTPLEEGPVTVIATSEHSHVTSSHTVSFNERKVEFETGQVYLVGDKQFNTGESVVGVASWTNAKYALKLEAASSEDPNVSRQVKARVTLHAGDQLKLREGPLNTGWKDLFQWVDGAKVWNYEQAGAIDGTHLRCGSSPSGNVEVLRDGTYDIYYKDLISGGFNIYIGFAPVIHFDKNELSMGITSTTVVTLHEYTAPVVTVSSDSSVVSISEGTQTDNGLEYTLTANAVGTATITATDANNKTATIAVTVREDTGGVTVPIYLNTYGMFDADGVVPFVHAFSSTTPTAGLRDLQMTKVNGQELIYTANIPEEYDSAIFVRMPAGTTEFSWEAAYNQTKDEQALFGDNNMFTMSGYEDKEGGEGSWVVGTWGTFDPEIIYIIPPEYYLVGSFNSWTVADNNYALEKVSDGLYRIEGVELAQGALLQVVSYTETWYVNHSAPAGCGYTLVDNGLGGYNMSISAAGTYTVDFRPANASANPITLSTGEVPPEPPVSDFAYYVEGSFTTPAWSKLDAYGMTQDAEDANHYYLNHVELAVNDTLKVYDAVNDQFLSNASTWQSSWELDNEGNIKILTAGTYTIDFYVNSDNNNHISLYDESVVPPEPGEEFTAVVSADLSVFAGWDNPVTNVSLYVWTADGSTPLGNWNACLNNLSSGSVTITSTKAVTHFILYLSEGGATKQTIDLDCDISESGNYTLDLSDIKWQNVGTEQEQNWKMYNITIIKDGDDPIDPPEPPVSSKLKFTMNVSALASCFSESTGGFSIYAWANDGTEVFGTFGPDSGSAGNLDDGVVEIDFPEGKVITGAIIYLWEGSDLKQSFNITLNISAAGDYVINIPASLTWELDGEVWKFSGITITAQ